MCAVLANNIKESWKRAKDGGSPQDLTLLIKEELRVNAEARAAFNQRNSEKVVDILKKYLTKGLQSEYATLFSPFMFFP